MLQTNVIRLVFLLEQSRPGSRLFPLVTDAANLAQRLRGRMKAVGRVRVLDLASAARELGWSFADA